MKVGVTVVLTDASMDTMWVPELAVLMVGPMDAMLGPKLVED